jgi:hypothetical protein
MGFLSLQNAVPLSRLDDVGEAQQHYVACSTGETRDDTAVRSRIMRSRCYRQSLEWIAGGVSQ